MRDVEKLIPHRDPFLYVDQLLTVTKEEIVGARVFSDTESFLRGSFPDFYFVPGVILIEAMAQCGGAGIKNLGLAEGFFGLAHVENVHFYKGVEYERTFRMVIKNIKIAEKYIKQSGVGYVDNEVCLDLTWMCVKFQ